MRDERDYVEYVQARMPALRRLAYRLSGDWPAADDLVQECLVALYRHWRKACSAGGGGRPGGGCSAPLPPGPSWCWPSPSWPCPRSRCPTGRRRPRRRLLGWRSATTLVALTLPMGLSSIDLGTGARERLTRFDTGSTCELGMQTCQVFDLQLATGLLADVTVRRASSPDRGPWPFALTIPVTVVLLGATFLLWRRAMRRLRR
ncbi:RNA polymerase sigma factor [Dactylosporangium sucinum]|uniref:RNA polymerase sigma-70 region 2 domain-containing protein n=1 Tax=Dactylosporangium sucinum TaxID=1424081 RepID=A0A917TSF6_9ACTN|nr:sigma factor [Dactylosporangium sucinum]GGM34898.1 hypothetical protein GCM10007977_040490 [Dactylosporangium sucinum]